MLSVTRMAGEQVSLHRTDEVVEEIVDSAVMKLRRSRNTLPVTVIRPQEILTAPMDATLMEQVILNLLENAVNHAEGATRIRVEIAGQGDTVMIAVEDDGAASLQSCFPQLFDRKLLPQPRSCADGRRGTGTGAHAMQRHHKSTRRPHDRRKPPRGWSAGMPVAACRNRR